MAVHSGAGPRVSFVRDDASARDKVQGWANVRPLDRSPAGGVGQWIDLLASISHELRTPLNAVIGFSDAMHQELFGPIGNARYQEYVGHIRASGVELLAAAEDALAMTAVLAQPKAVTFDDVALAPIVAAAAEDIASRNASRCVGIEIDIAEGLEVRSDRRILARAVRQLVAVGYSRAASGSTVRVAAVAEHGLIELMVEVSDVVAGAPSLHEHRRDTASPFELGLGRRELAMWLAIALLDLLDCRLETDSRDGALNLRTTLEQSIQGSFFADASVCA